MESLEKLSLKRSVAPRDLLKREGVYFQKFHTLTAPQLRRQCTSAKYREDCQDNLDQIQFDFYCKLIRGLLRKPSPR